jgi:hypothetical protein
MPGMVNIMWHILHRCGNEWAGRITELTVDSWQSTVDHCKLPIANCQLMNELENSLF